MWEAVLLIKKGVITGMLVTFVCRECDVECDFSAV